VCSQLSSTLLYKSAVDIYIIQQSQFLGNAASSLRHVMVLILTFFRWIRVLPSSGVCPQPGFGRGFGLGRSRAKPQSENGLALTRFYLQTTSVAHSGASSKRWRTDRPQVRTEGCEDKIFQQSGTLFAHRSTKFLRFSFSGWS
jgi:hypothetical protein